MGYFLSEVQANDLLAKLKKEYRIFAPKRYEKAGRYSDTDIIRDRIFLQNGGHLIDRAGYEQFL